MSVRQGFSTRCAHSIAGGRGPDHQLHASGEAGGVWHRTARSRFRIETAGEYLDTVRGLVEQRPEWEIKEDVYLATFAYSKLAMWHDLEIIKNNGTDHPVVLTLAGAGALAQRDHTPSALPSLPQDLAGGRLDDVLDVRDQFAVLPADYSQLLAITAARSGVNLVIHGPPGTGKSQTIANIIATFLAEGKSVIFVSEKTAALDVVKRRLDEKQLGVFCLDLHSERGSKASVYQQLQESVDDRRAVRRLEFDYAALTERRRELNRVVRALHEVREPLRRTAFQVQGRFASIRGEPHVPFEVRDIETLDQARLAGILEVADRVRLRRREFKEHLTSHWRVLKSGTPSLELADKIRRDMQVLTAAAEGPQSAAPRLGEALGLAPPETQNEIAHLEDVARHLAKAPGVPQTLVPGLTGCTSKSPCSPGSPRPNRRTSSSSSKNWTSNWRPRPKMRYGNGFRSGIPICIQLQSGPVNWASAWRAVQEATPLAGSKAIPNDPTSHPDVETLLPG